MRLLFEIFGQTLRTLWAHKLRSFLTMFGIAWGVGSLLLLVGLGEGFRSGNRRQFNELGENVMFIWGGRAPAVDGNFNSMQWYSLNYQDYLDISTECPDVKLATPVIQRGDIRAVSDFFQTSGQLMGVKSDFSEIRYTPIGDGRWLNPLDDEQKRAVVVIGDEARKVLFPGRPSIGNTILLNGVRFQVVGTLKRLGHGDNNNVNLRIMIPFNTMKMYFPPTGNQNRVDRVSFINYQPRSRVLHETAKEEVHRIISRNHGGFNYKDPDAFDEWDTIRTVDQVGKIFDAMNMFLGSVGLVTLALGAIGIINIMLVAVADRTREIGLRKALGATNRSIMFQFFTEGAFLTLMSGGLGMAGAAALMAALAKLPQPPGFDTPRLVPMTAALAIISLAFAGVLAGVYPARKAALLQPVEALRKE
jgi:putative ABC transport system permease protein